MKKPNWQNPLLGALTLTILMVSLFIGGLILKITWLENSIPTLFNAVATILVGLYAFSLYKKQKNDSKKDAANIILLEVQNAEKVLKLAQRFLDKPIAELPYDTITMPTESWCENKYLFVADFDKNQWEAISNFYSVCQLFDESVRTNASYFQKNEEQVRVNIQKRSAELTKDYNEKIDKAKTPEDKLKLRTELRTKIDEATALYLDAVTTYNPKKPIDDAKQCVEVIKLNISLSSAINKLKELAK